VLALDPIVVRAGAVSASGRGTINLSAATAGRLELESRFSFPAEEESAVSAELLELDAAFDHAVITEVMLRSARLNVEAARFARPEFLQGMLGETAAVPMSGAFDAQLQLDLPVQGNSSFDAAVATRSTSFYLSGLRFGITAQALVHCKGTRDEAKCELDLDAPYLLFDQQPGKGGATLWLHADVKKPLDVSMQRGTIDGSVLLQGGDPKSVVSELVGGDWLAQFGLTLVPTGPLAGTLELHRSPTELFLRGEVSSGSSSVQGHLHARSVTSGAWTVDMPTHRWGFQLHPGGISAFPLVGSDWLQSH
jgi:hypothetical protein